MKTMRRRRVGEWKAEAWDGEAAGGGARVTRSSRRRTGFPTNGGAGAVEGEPAGHRRSVARRPRPN